jgi:hypothetical protein
MVDPSKHADQRGWVETLLRHVPGFRGYLEKEYRRESDHLTRSHIADRLHACRKGINEFQRSLLEMGRLDELAAMERVISSLDTLSNRIKGDVRGYSGFFDFVAIGETELERIYEHDLRLVSDAEALVKQSEALAPGRDEPAAVAAQLQHQLDALAEKYGLRAKILTGLEPST